MTTITVFDSGIGGLTVLQQLRLAFPAADYIYYADLDHVPYGQKTPSVILSYMEKFMAEVVEAGTDAVVLACNTATSAAAATLREKWQIPIIGMEPAVKPAVTKMPQVNSGRVIVAATDLTLKLEKLQRLIQSLHAEDKVDKLSLQGLVDFAEQGIFGGKEVEDYLLTAFQRCDLDKTQTVVLGCTHFLYYYSVLHKVLPKHIDLIDGHDGTVRHVLSFFDTEEVVRVRPAKAIHYVVSGREASAAQAAFFDNCLEHAEKVYKIIQKEREDGRHETDDVCH